MGCGFLLAKKRKEKRIDKKEYDTKKKRLKERGNDKAGNNLRGKHNESRIDDKRKEPEREDGKGQGKKYKNRAKDGIKYPEDNSEHERIPKPKNNDTGNDVRSNENTEGAN
jgi:hypothetical protein